MPLLRIDALTTINTDHVHYVTHKDDPGGIPGREIALHIGFTNGSVLQMHYKSAEDRRMIVDRICPFASTTTATPPAPKEDSVFLIKVLGNTVDLGATSRIELCVSDVQVYSRTETSPGSYLAYTYPIPQEPQCHSAVREELVSQTAIFSAAGFQSQFSGACWTHPSWSNLRFILK